MTRPSGLLQWQQMVSTYLPHLSQPQLTVLVLWSFGIVLGPGLWPDDRGCHSGLCIGLLRNDPPRTAPRLVSRCPA